MVLGCRVEVVSSNSGVLVDLIWAVDVGFDDDFDVDVGCASACELIFSLSGSIIRVLVDSRGCVVGTGFSMRSGAEKL